jgi:uncharacterized membrane protein YedE/YeeE
MQTAWLYGLIGGLLIGLSAAIMLFFQGRIVGISGIASSLLAKHSDEKLWRAGFLGSMIAGASIYYYAYGAEAIQLQNSYPAMALAGLLVGFGTRLGGGCTSGHSVCGIARKSPRSITATLVFMLTAIITATLLYGGWL